jgi:geranylgeranyl pyrophosphate synthase
MGQAERWMTGYQRVLNWIAELIAGTAATPAQRKLLETAIEGLNGRLKLAAASGDCIPSIDLPLAVYGAIRGEEDGAVPLAAACALVCLAASLFDDLADGDRQSHWARYAAGEINLAAVIMLCALPPLILTKLDVLPLLRLRLQQILAEGALRICAGQQADLALTGKHDVETAEVEAAATGKTGERFATYCRMAAELAAAEPEATALYETFGREIGMGRQFVSDCHELLVDPECRDLVHGTRTLPIVAHMNRLSGADRSYFLDLLDRARTDRRAEETVRRELQSSGEMSRVLFRARLHFGRALAIVDRVGAREPGRTRLLHVVSPSCADSG